MKNQYWIVERWTEKRGWHFFDALYTRQDARAVARDVAVPTRIRKFVAA